MSVAANVLAYLNREGDFSYTLEAVARGSDWARDWKSAEEITEALGVSGFWAEPMRKKLPVRARTELVAEYLDEATEHCQRVMGPGWIFDSGRFCYRPEKESVASWAEKKAPQRRRHGRVKTELIRCDLGPIVDMSKSGIMVSASPRCRKRVGKVLKLTLRCMDVRMKLAVEVMWARPENGRTMLGLKFVGEKVASEAAGAKLYEMYQVAQLVCRATGVRV